MQNPKWPIGSHIGFLLVIALALAILNIVQENSTDDKIIMKSNCGIFLGATGFKMADLYPYWIFVC